MPLDISSSRKPIKEESLMLSSIVRFMATVSWIIRTRGFILTILVHETRRGKKTSSRMPRKRCLAGWRRFCNYAFGCSSQKLGFWGWCLDRINLLQQQRFLEKRLIGMGVKIHLKMEKSVGYEKKPSYSGSLPSAALSISDAIHLQGP